MDYHERRSENDRAPRGNADICSRGRRMQTGRCDWASIEDSAVRRHRQASLLTEAVSL
jgi:hypothetical protein